MSAKKKLKEHFIPNRCEGWRRYGGAMSLGLPRWEQCKESGIAMLTFKDQDTGRERKLPACQICWQECIDTGLKILKVEPITPPVS